MDAKAARGLVLVSSSFAPLAVNCVLASDLDRKLFLAAGTFPSMGRLQRSGKGAGNGPAVQESPEVDSGER
jgi:hypothetical protein